MMNDYKRWLVSGAMALSCAAACAAQGRLAAPAFTGEFSEVAHSTASGDCSGFRLRLWNPGDGHAMIGELSRDDGTCNKAGAPIYDVAFDASAASLRFTAPGADPRHKELMDFRGTFSADALRGVIRITTARSEGPDDVTEIPVVLNRVASN